MGGEGQEGKREGLRRRNIDFEALAHARQEQGLECPRA